MPARIKYTKELLEPIVARVDSYAALCREVGIEPYTGAQTHLRNRVRDLGIDTTHFLGRGHNKGKIAGNRKDITVWLVANSRIPSHRLRIRLIEDGIKEAKCELCGNTQWAGEPIPLELDHLNNDHWDCRLENLQVICPNCHALETRKRKK